MIDPPRKSEILRYADGELSGARAEAVAAYLLENPSAAREVDALRRLRGAAKKEFDSNTPALSDGMRTRLEYLIAATPEATQLSGTQLAAAHPVATNVRRAPFVPRWRIAAAILLGCGLLAGAYWLAGGGVWRGMSDELANQVDDSSFSGPNRAIALAVTRKHLTCQRMKDHFYDQRFPRVLAELPAAARQHLAGDAPIPDLEPLGYEFAGAGGCMLPGGETLHILYRSRSDAHRHVSIFAQRYSGQVAIEPDEVLLLAGPDAAHPLVCWRRGETICFLIADDSASFTGAARALEVKIPV